MFRAKTFFTGNGGGFDRSMHPLYLDFSRMLRIAVRGGRAEPSASFYRRVYIRRCLTKSNRVG